MFFLSSLSFAVISVINLLFDEDREEQDEVDHTIGVCSYYNSFHGAAQLEFIIYDNKPVFAEDIVPMRYFVSPLIN